jgi:hypothetical protein
MGIKIIHITGPDNPWLTNAVRSPGPALPPVRSADIMGNKTAQVVGNQTSRLPDTHAGRLLAYDPAAYDGMVAVMIRQSKELLVNVPLFPVFPAGLFKQAIAFYDPDIGPFTG